MPSLDHLPVEILFSIARFIGSAYLRRHTETQLLFKKWWQVARIVANEDLVLSIQSINRYLHASENAQNLMCTSLKRLIIVLREDPHWGSLKTPTAAVAINNDEARFPADFVRYLVDMLRWWDRVYENIIRLGLHLKRMSLMRSCTITFGLNSKHSGVKERVLSDVISRLLGNLPTTLTVLTIDNGDSLQDWISFWLPYRGNHICALLKNQTCMPHLRHLRLQCLKLCPDVFEMIFSERFPQQLESLTIIIDRHSHYTKLTWTTANEYCSANFFCSRCRKMGKHLRSSSSYTETMVGLHLPYLKALKIIHSDNVFSDRYDTISTGNRDLLRLSDNDDDDNARDNQSCCCYCSEGLSNGHREETSS